MTFKFSYYYNVFPVLKDYSEVNYLSSKEIKTLYLYANNRSFRNAIDVAIIRYIWPRRGNNIGPWTYYQDNTLSTRQ